MGASKDTSVVFLSGFIAEKDYCHYVPVVVLVLGAVASYTTVRKNALQLKMALWLTSLEQSHARSRLCGF